MNDPSSPTVQKLVNPSGDASARISPNENVEILVVEDSRTQAQQLKSLLEREGFRVTLAENGKAALDQLSRAKPNLIISDVVMPGMDGYELCRAIREDEELKLIPLILLTSMTEPEDVFRGLDCGADNFVPKPYQPAYLLKCVQLLLINFELRNDRMSFSIDVFFGGRRHSVSAERVQILHHLLSTYETAIEKTRELEKTRHQLQELNEQLESRVKERTAELEAEVERRREDQQVLLDQANLIDLARDAIIVMDADARVVSWNQGAEEVYGWKSEEVLGKEIVEVVYPDRSVFVETRRSLLATGEWHGEVEQVHRDGRKLMINHRITLVRDSDGAPKSILSIGTNITEQRNLEKEFYQAQKQESIGSLAGGIAHDFNNLLAVINGYSEMIIGQAENPAQARLAREVLGAGRRAMNLVQQILTFARKAEVRFEPIKINEIVNDMIGVAEATFSQKIQIILDLADNLPRVAGDSTQIYQVLMNLLVNARDAIEESGEITIATRFAGPRGREAKQGNAKHYLCVEISDTGTGIPPEVQERIFDPFFTTKKVGEGTGLGLAVVEGIIKSHGGTIELSSTVGVGSRFRVSLPVVEEEIHVPEREDELESVPGGQRQVVLVAEDERAIREMMSMVLKQHGYTVLSAQDGREALSILSREKVDLIIADYDMPHVGGQDLFREVKKQKISAGFVLASGYLPQDRLEELQRQGLEWHLLKPVSIRQLLSKINEVLTRVHN